MGTIDIIYLTLVGVLFITGMVFAVKMFVKIRNNSITDFKQRQNKNRNKIKYGRHN